MAGLDKIQVLDLDEVQLLKAMSVVPGIGHAALFRPEKRAEVLERCGLSPRVDHVRTLWSGDGGDPWDWLDCASLSHSTVTRVEGPAGDDFLGFQFSVYATGLNARLVWKVLVDEGPEWAEFWQLPMGPPEVTGSVPESVESVVGATVGSSEKESEPEESVCVVESGDERRTGGFTPQIVDGCKATLSRLGLQCLTDSGGVTRDMGSVGLAGSPGFCYTALFRADVSGTIAKALGPRPTAGIVLELYMCACVLDFANTCAVEVLSMERSFHIQPGPGSWHDNLMVLLGNFAAQVDKVVGAIESEPAWNGLSNFEQCLWDDTVVLLNEPMYIMDEQVMPEQSVLNDRTERLWKVTRATVFRIKRGCIVLLNGVRIDCRETGLLFRTNSSFHMQLVEGSSLEYVSRRVTESMCAVWQSIFGGPADSDLRHALSESVFLVLRVGSYREVVRPSLADFSPAALVQLHDDLNVSRPLNRYRFSDVRNVSAFPKIGGTIVVDDLQCDEERELDDPKVSFGIFTVGAMPYTRRIAFQEGCFPVSTNFKHRER